MEMDVSGGRIKLDKGLNEMDKLVLDFVSFLNKHKAKYVLVSGYVSILFGRSRSSEDIDIIVKKISKKKFTTLWRDLTEFLLHICKRPRRGLRFLPDGADLLALSQEQEKSSTKH